MAIPPGSMSTKVLIEYTAKIDSVLKANADMKAARAAMTAEEKKAADEARAAAKEREAASKVALAMMQAEGERGRELQKMIDDVSKAEQRAGDVRKQTHGNWLDTLAKVSLAYSAVSRVMGEAFGLMEEAGERSRLEDAAHGVELEKLKVAAGGTRTELELLTFAAKTQHGALALNTDQMVMVQQAMRELGREGFALTDIQEGITTALTKGTTRSLKEFGIVVEEGSDKATTHGRILEALAEKASTLDTTYTTTAENVKGANVSLTNSIDQVKDAAGNLLIKLTPLIKAMADLGTNAASFISKISDSMSEHSPLARFLDVAGLGVGAIAADEVSKRRDRGEYGNNGALDAIGAMALGTTLDTSPDKLTPNTSPFRANGGQAAAYIQSHLDDLTGKGMIAGAESLGRLLEANFKSLPTKAKTASSTRGGEMDWLLKIELAINGKLNDIADAASAQIAGMRMNMGDAAQFKRWTPPANSNGSALSRWDAADRSLPSSFAAPDDSAGVAIDEANEEARRMAPFLKEQKKQKFLENTFGKLTEFSAYKIAFDSLSGAVGSAMTAWIDGSQSAGAAFKHFIGDALKGLAVQMEIEALKHGAYALGSLAFGDFAGAGKHAAAAAAFAVGGIAAGVAAKELGTTASSSKNGAGASGGGSGGGGGGDSGGGSNSSNDRPIVIIAGDDGDQTPRMRQANFQRKLDAALGGPTSGGS